MSIKVLFDDIGLNPKLIEGLDDEKLLLNDKIKSTI